MSQPKFKITSDTKITNMFIGPPHICVSAFTGADAQEISSARGFGYVYYENVNDKELDPRHVNVISYRTSTRVDPSDCGIHNKTQLLTVAGGWLCVKCHAAIKRLQDVL